MNTLPERYNVLTAYAPAGEDSVKASIAVRMLAEMPRFFNGNWSARLREMFQNAYRAGAKNVWLDLDTTRKTVVMTDDGQGCADPAIFLLAGATGWDESKVTEPAGAGFFALLSEEITHVTVASWTHARAWRMSFTPEQALARQEIPVCELSAPLTESGTLVSLTLGDPLDELLGIETDRWTSDEPTTIITLKPIRLARALYPFTLTVTLDGIATDIPVYRSWEPTLTVTLAPFGTLEWHIGNTFKSAYAEASWDYGVFRSTALNAAIGKVKSPWVKFLNEKGEFRWLIDPACGVRPVLPGRNELVDNVALFAAASAMTSALADQLKATVEQIAPAWPDGLEYSLLVKLNGPVWMTNYALDIVGLLGWQNITNLAWEDAYSYETSDGWESEKPRHSRWYRAPRESHSSAVADTLTHLGTPTLYVKPTADKGDANAVTKLVKASVKVEGLRVDWRSPNVAFAKSITAPVDDGEVNLPFLMSEDGFALDLDGVEPHAKGPKTGKGKNSWRTEVYPHFIFAGTPAEFSEWLTSEREAGLNWALIFFAFTSDDMGSFLDGESGIDYETVLEDILREVVVFERPTMIRARNAYYDTQAALVELADVLHGLRRSALLVKSPVRRAKLKKLLKSVESEIDQVVAIRDGLVVKAGLAPKGDPSAKKN